MKLLFPLLTYTYSLYRLNNDNGDNQQLRFLRKSFLVEKLRDTIELRKGVGKESFCSFKGCCTLTKNDVCYLVHFCFWMDDFPSP